MRPGPAYPLCECENRTHKCVCVYVCLSFWLLLFQFFSFSFVFIFLTSFGCVNSLFQFSRSFIWTSTSTIFLCCCCCSDCMNGGDCGICETTTKTQLQTANRWYKLIEKHFHLHILFRITCMYTARCSFFFVHFILFYFHWFALNLQLMISFFIIFMCVRVRCISKFKHSEMWV